MANPTPRAVYDWLAPIREKCPEAWPSSIYLDQERGQWAGRGLSPYTDTTNIAHDLITLHMLRWLAEYEWFPRCEDDYSLRRVACMVASFLHLTLAPWPGGGE